MVSVQLYSLCIVTDDHYINASKWYFSTAAQVNNKHVSLSIEIHRETIYLFGICNGTFGCGLESQIIHMSTHALLFNSLTFFHRQEQNENDWDPQEPLFGVAETNCQHLFLKYPTTLINNQCYHHKTFRSSPMCNFCSKAFVLCLNCGKQLQNYVWTILLHSTKTKERRAISNTCRPTQD